MDARQKAQLDDWITRGPPDPVEEECPDCGDYVFDGDICEGCLILDEEEVRDGIFEALTPWEQREVDDLTGVQEDTYYRLREQGQSHNMAMMLASKQGPKGYVR